MSASVSTAPSLSNLLYLIKFKFNILCAAAHSLENTYLGLYK